MKDRYKSPAETSGGKDEGAIVRGTFPKQWGTPPADEQQRHAWILRHAARAAEARKVRGAAAGRRPGVGPRLSGRHANRAIAMRVDADNLARQRLIELRRTPPWGEVWTHRGDAA